jgi:hypothetical protein
MAVVVTVPIKMVVEEVLAAMETTSAMTKIVNSGSGGRGIVLVAIEVVVTATFLVSSNK